MPPIATASNMTLSRRPLLEHLAATGTAPREVVGGRRGVWLACRQLPAQFLGVGDDAGADGGREIGQAEGGHGVTAVEKTEMVE